MARTTGSVRPSNGTSSARLNPIAGLRRRSPVRIERFRSASARSRPIMLARREGDCGPRPSAAAGLSRVVAPLVRDPPTCHSEPAGTPPTVRGGLRKRRSLRKPAGGRVTESSAGWFPATLPLEIPKRSRRETHGYPQRKGRLPSLRRSQAVPPQEPRSNYRRLPAARATRPIPHPYRSTPVPNQSLPGPRQNPATVL